ncbi:MAG: NAD(P)-dependent oxidoreductase [Bacteriovoracaceae bacterium]
MLFKVARLNTSPYSKGALFPLEKKRLERLKVGPHRVQYLENVSEFDGVSPLILITNTHTDPDTISKEILAGTALMIHPNSGYDNFTAQFVKDATFPIVLGNEIRKQAVVEYILSALFQHFCPLPDEKTWNHNRTFARPLLSSKKVLILGQGHIGKYLGDLLTLLGCDVHEWDPHFGPFKFPDEKMDVVILALSLNAKTRNIIDQNFLQSKLSDQFLLINTARGELIKEADLLKVLKKKKEAKAYLDVFEPEPKDFSSLSSHSKQIQLSSHVAGVYQNLNHAMVDFEEMVIKDFLQDLPLFFQNYREDFLQQRYTKGQLL